MVVVFLDFGFRAMGFLAVIMLVVFLDFVVRQLRAAAMLTTTSLLFTMTLLT
jgi:hypothetical protein